MEPTDQIPGSNNKVKLIIILGLSAVLILGVLFIVIQQKKLKEVSIVPGRNNVTPTPEMKPDTLMKIVGDKKIVYGDLQKIIDEKYGKGKINDLEKNAILDQLVENEILDQAAKKLNIDTSDSKIIQLAKYKFPKAEGQTLSLNELDSAKYDYLRDQITTLEVASRLAFVISYWIPSFDYPETIPADKKVLIDKQRQEGKIALDEIEKRIINNEPPLNVARSIIANPAYSNLKSILGLNGYVVDNNNNIFLFINPKPYVYHNDQDSKLFYDTLFSMKENTVKTLREEEGPGSGGRVIKLVSISDGKFKTYNDWLEAQKKNLVKTP